MVGQIAGLIAGLAVAANAFLIPSSISLPGFEVNEHDGGKIDLSGLLFPLEQFTPNQDPVLVELDCPGCSASTVPLFDAQQEIAAKSLAFWFTLSNDQKTLEVNGLPLFPFSAQPSSLVATLRVEAESGVSIDEEDIHYFAWAHTLPSTDGTAAQLVDLTFQTTTFQEQAVDVSSIKVRMVADEEGKLSLVDVITAPSAGLPRLEPASMPDLDLGLRPEHEVEVAQTQEDHCTSGSPAAMMICRLRETVVHKMSEWNLVQPESRPQRRPCPGKLRGHGPPLTHGGPAKFMLGHPSGKFEHPPHHEHDHHEQHEHHHDHMRSFIHGFASTIRAFVVGFVVPVLIGIVAGMAASLIGMVAGSFVAWLWIKLVRGGKRGNATASQLAREARAEEDVLIGEKDGLLDHAPQLDVEAPPVYAEKE